MFCPKCNAEYREGFRKCADCDALLVRELLQEDDNQPVLLMTVANGVDSHIICDLLEQQEIPTMKKHRGADSILTTAFGIQNLLVDIYVPKGAREKAAEVIELFTNEE